MSEPGGTEALPDPLAALVTVGEVSGELPLRGLVEMTRAMREAGAVSFTLGGFSVQLVAFSEPREEREQIGRAFVAELADTHDLADSRVVERLRSQYRSAG